MPTASTEGGRSLYPTPLPRSMKPGGRLSPVQPWLNAVIALRQRILHGLLSHLLVSCCCLVVQSCLTLCDPMDCSRTGFPALHHLPESAEIHVQPNHLILCHSLLSPSIFPCIRVFFNELDLHIRRIKSIGASVSASIFPMTIQG